MIEPMPITKLLILYITLLAITSLKLNDLIHDLKKTLLNKKKKSIRGLE